MDKLQQLHYSSEGYQRGTSEANRLHKLIPSVTKKEIQHRLDRQPIYQIYNPKPKTVKFPHYYQEKPNHTHQIDLLVLPNDKKYKYALTVIDIASRYKDAKPAKSRKPQKQQTLCKKHMKDHH